MAIVWTVGPKAGRAEYVGAVLRVGTHERQVMSDVWDTEAYAEVWTGTGLTTVVLDDWAYEAVGGGWTKEYEEAAQWGPLPCGGYDLPKTHRFLADAKADATAAVWESVGKWSALNELVTDTCVRLRAAVEPVLHRAVEVIKGRKAPLGLGYEVSGWPVEGQYGTSVNLRNLRGDFFSYISVDNIRVIDPEKHVIGDVACEKCRRTFRSAVEAGMIARAWADTVCRECRLDGVLDGELGSRLPRSAKNQTFSAFHGRGPLRGTGEGEQFVRALFAEPDDMATWLIFCDWLEERGDERADGLREALVGKPAIKPMPIRKKDLKVTPWVKLEGKGQVELECVISGFPRIEGTCEEVLVRVSWMPGHFGNLLFFARKVGEEVSRPYANAIHRRRIKGPLLRACKAVVPPPDITKVS